MTLSFFSPRKSNRGLTLVETLMVIALFTAGMAVLASMYYDFNTLYGVQQTITDTALSTGQIVNEVENLTVPADSVISSHTFSAGSYASSASTLVLEIPSVDSSGVVISGKYDYAVMYRSGTNVYRLLETDASSARGAGTKLLGSSITALSFTYDNADVTLAKTVTVSVTAQTYVKNAPVSNTLRSSFRLRNHS
jgi:hypothetical protein